MKIAALLFVASCLHCSAQTFTKVIAQGSPDIEVFVPAGKVAKILTFLGDTNGHIVVGESEVASTSHINDSNQMMEKAAYFAGPMTFLIRNRSSISAQVCTYRITDNEGSQAAPTPSNSVAIPSDASGPVKIILESSVDMITWTAANPGSYGASTEKRFFRVRAEATP